MRALAKKRSTSVGVKARESSLVSRHSLANLPPSISSTCCACKDIPHYKCVQRRYEQQPAGMGTGGADLAHAEGGEAAEHLLQVPCAPAHQAVSRLPHGAVHARAGSAAGRSPPTTAGLPAKFEQHASDIKAPGALMLMSFQTPKTLDNH